MGTLLQLMFKNFMLLCVDHKAGWLVFDKESPEKLRRVFGDYMKKLEVGIWSISFGQTRITVWLTGGRCRVVFWGADWVFVQEYIKCNRIYSLEDCSDFDRVKGWPEKKKEEPAEEKKEEEEPVEEKA